jgi:hypothetical protein
MRKLKPNVKNMIKRLKDRFFTKDQSLIIPTQEYDVDVVYEGIGYEIVSGENEDEILKLAIANRLGNNSKLDEKLSKFYDNLGHHIISIYTYEEIIQQTFEAYLKKIPQLVDRNLSHKYDNFGLIINFTELTLPLELRHSRSKEHSKLYEKLLSTNSLIRIVYVLFDDYSTMYNLYHSVKSLIKVYHHV